MTRVKNMYKTDGIKSNKNNKLIIVQSCSIYL